MFNNRGRTATPSNWSQPMEGQPVYDTNNAKVGTISSVAGQGDYFVVSKGVLVPHDVYLPRSAVARSDSNGVYLNVSKDALKESRYMAPPTAGKTAADQTAYATPPGAQAPTGTPSKVEATADDIVSAPARHGAAGEQPIATGSQEVEDITVPIHEEALLATKVREQIGTVRVHRYVVEEEQTVVTPIEHEELSIDHVATAQPIATTLQAGDSNLFTETDIDVPLMGERLNLGKETRVVDEVHIRKHLVTEQRQASGKVRKERVRVDNEEVQFRGDEMYGQARGDLPESRTQPNETLRT